MIIEHVVIENYRGLLEVDIPVHKFSVIIGENDSGKTSFLYALKAFFEQKKIEEEENWYNHDVKKNIMITLTFSEAPEGFSAEFVQPDGKVIITGVFQIGKPPKYHTLIKGKECEIKKDMEYFSSEHVIFVPVVRSIDEQFAIKKSAILGKILREEMKKAISEQDDLQRALKAIETAMAQSIGYAGTRIGSYLRQHLNDNGVELSFAALKIELLDGIDISPKLSDDKSKDILLANKGAGTQNNAILALFRYIAELRIGKKMIFLLEEPENSLHPKAQYNLLNVVQQISNDSQVFVTTHSTVFIDKTEYENNILFTMQQSGSTMARTFKEVTSPEIRNELGIKVSDALLKGGGNCALLVEGSTEEDIMPAFIKAMNVNELSLGAAIVGMGGSDETKTTTQIKMLGSYDIPCIVMLDGDAEKCHAELSSLQAKNLIPNLIKVFRLSKGTIEDYYPRNIIVQVMKNEYGVEISESEIREGSSANDLKRIFHERKCGPFVKPRFGRQCVNLMRRPGTDVSVPDEIQDIIQLVVKVASQS